MVIPEEKQVIKGDGIGWDGHTLAQMLLESEQLFDKTGHYMGLEQLELKESDPILYEKIFSRIRGGVVTARETALNIAANPIIEEEGELCFTLYTPEGDSVALSTGIIIHVHTMSDAIKYMIRKDYEENPGIADGDIFVNNDPQIGDVHNADIQTLVPIFWEGECIGWAGAVTHELDVGARTPGSMAVGPINRLEDGIDLPAMKCGQNDTLFRDYQERCVRAVRTPLFWTLDEKTRLTGCHMIRRAVHDIVRALGIDTYKQFIREVIEEGRRSLLSRVREQLVPGTYQTAAFIDYQFAGEESLPEEAAVDGLLHAPLEMTVMPDGKLDLSFDGANAWGYHSFNCSPSGMQGAFWAILAQTLISNDKVNDGAYLATNLHLAPGTWTNPQNPITSHSDAWYGLVPAFSALTRPLSRAWQARGFVEEVICGWGDGNTLQGGSIDAFGEQSAICNMESSCVGAGAGIISDGLDYASSAWNPQGDMGDIENWELLEPLLYLGRRVKPNSGGFGRRRGGSGYDSLRMLWNQPRYKLQNLSEGRVFAQAGVFGGYPAAAGYRHNVHDTNLQQIFEDRQPYPTHDPDPGDSTINRLVEGRVVCDKRAMTMLKSFSRYDLYLAFVKGGPGLGDPLERAASEIERDLNEGFLAGDVAVRVYGAAIEKRDGLFAVDVDATASRRKEMLDERAARAVPVRDWIAQERERRVLSRDVIEPVRNMYRSSMELSPQWAAQYRAFWNLDDEFTF